MSTDNERMAVLETTVKMLDEKITDIQSDVKAIILTLSKQPGFEAKIAALEEKIVKLERSTGFWKWFGPTLTGIVSSILAATITFLVINYLQNSKWPYKSLRANI